MRFDMPVCVFAKPPLPGLSKTRLSPALGSVGAAALARAFMVDTWSMLGSLPWARPVFATTQELPADFEQELRAEGSEIDVWLQGDGDFGARLERILKRGLAEARGAIVIGSDSPGLPARLLEQANDALRKADAVLGPSDDGGFYLIGLNACPDGLLEELPWSRDDTFEKTLARLQSRGLSTAVIDSWFDIDEPADLARLRQRLALGELSAPATARVLASTSAPTSA